MHDAARPSRPGSRDRLASTTECCTVPWVVWDDLAHVHCLRCGDKGSIPGNAEGDPIVAFMKAFIQIHRNCPSPSANPRGQPGG